MKRIGLYAAFVLLLLASLLIPARTAFAATTPTTTAIQNAYGYQHVFEDNDQFYIVQYEFEYAAANQTPDWVGAEFLGQFADDTEVFASIQPWGYYGATDTTLEWWFAIYISADDVSSLGITWQDANNKVALAGNPALPWSGAVPYDSTTAITYSTATTQAETETELEARFRTMALYYENLSGGEDDYIVTIDGVMQFTEDGETAFTSTFSALEVAIPGLFSQATDVTEPDTFIDTDKFTGPFNGNAQIYGVNWVAQTFTPTDSYAASGIQIRVYRVGNPGAVTVSLRITAADVPTGGDLATSILDGDDFTTDTDGDWETFSFAQSYNLNANTTYAIVVRATSGNVNNYIRWLGYEIPYVGDDWDCTPLAEPYTAWNTIDVYNQVNGYIYQVSGATWPGAVYNYTYASRYNPLTNVWTDINGMLDEGTVDPFNTEILVNRENGDMYCYQATRDPDMVQMYDQTDSDWHEFTNTQNVADFIGFHDTTNNILHIFDDTGGASVNWTHPTGTGGSWVNTGSLAFQAGNAGIYGQEVIRGTVHYNFDMDAPTVIESYDETTQTMTRVAIGGAWNYKGWAVWYDEDEDTIYGVWSPVGENLAPENCHLCTFNTLTNTWIEGDNLGLNAYAGLPNWDQTFEMWGWFIDGYVYITGCASGVAYTTGSPYFKFPVPQLLGDGIEGQRCNSADSGGTWTGAPDWDMAFVVMSYSGGDIYPDVPGDWDWGGLPDDFGLSDLWFSSLFWLIATFCMMIASMKVLHSNKAIWSVFILMTPLGYYIGFLAMQIMVGIAIICVMAFIYQFFFRPSGV